MHATLTKLGRKLVRGVCAAALVAGCGGTLRIDVASLSDDEVQIRTTRAAIDQGRDYVDALAAGLAARRAAVARRAAAAAGPATQAAQ
jgi:hypothetical protein